jgi:hypothetical protein
MSDIAQQLGRELTERGLWRDFMSERWYRPRWPGHTYSVRHGVPKFHPAPKEKRTLLGPDLDDWPTVGALHGLAMEVCGGPVELRWHNGEWWATEARWTQGDAEWGTGPTPGHALGALLLAVWDATQPDDNLPPLDSGMPTG